MNNSNKLLILGGIICFILAIFQIAIGFSPSLSLYFGAPENLVKSPNTLIVTSVTIGAILALFGLYAFSGAGKLVQLPWTKQILIGVGTIFLLRGSLLFPELLVVFNVIESAILIEQRFICFSIGALIVGFVFIKGAMNITVKNKEKHKHKGKTSENHLDKDEVIKKLPILQGLNVLDAGCGDGYMSVIFADAVGESGKVYATDIDANAIETIKTNNKLKKLKNLKVSIEDITDKTSFLDNSMDLIYLSTVVHGFSQLQTQGFIKEVKRLLKPNGILAILEMKKEPMPFGPPQEIRLTPDDLKKLLPFAPIKTVGVSQYFYLQLFENSIN